MNPTLSNTGFPRTLAAAKSSLLLSDWTLVTHIDTIQELPDILVLYVAFLFTTKTELKKNSVYDGRSGEMVRCMFTNNIIPIQW